MDQEHTTSNLSTFCTDEGDTSFSVQESRKICQGRDGGEVSYDMNGKIMY